MSKLNFGRLAHGPHADLIHGMAHNCAADSNIQAVWVGGSLASGTGDRYSDIDFRIAVEPGQVGEWANPDWDQYLPQPPCGGTLVRFGEHALLHHMVLADGTIVDFYVQDTTRHKFEPQIVVLACRNAAFGAMLEQFSRPAAALAKEIEGAVAQQLFVDYWIITHKQLKGLARAFTLSPFVGLYWERLSLLRAWHMQIVGKDINARATIHMLGALHKGLAGKLSEAQQAILGLPSRTPDETITVIEAIRAEIARIGPQLADQHQFTYPHELESVVQRAWDEYKGITS